MILSSCQNQTKKSGQTSSGYAVLAGKASSKSITFGNTTITTSKDSSFFEKVFLKKSGFHRISNGNKTVQLFLCPGDSLYLILDKSNTAIGGTGAEVNNFLRTHTELANSNSKFLDTHNKAIFSSELTNFNSKLDSLKFHETRHLEVFIERHPISEIFTKRLSNDIDYRYKRYKILYPHNYYRHHNFQKIANVTKTYFTDIMKGSFNQPELLESDIYIRCVNRYLDALAVGKYKFQHLEFAPDERINARYQAILDLKANANIQDFLLKEHLIKVIENYAINNIESSYTRFKADCKNEAFRQEVKEQYTAAHTRREDAHDIKIYRQIGDVELEAHVFYPDGFDKKDKRPVHLYFHGGGWAVGMPEWNYEGCKKAASEGRVSISFGYRLRHVHGTSIRDAVSDALAAVAWTRKNSKELGIDEKKILAEGFSAGGHLAACTAMLDNPEDFGVKSNFGTRPNAIILGSAAYDVTARDVYDIDYDGKSISPLYLVQENLVPMLLLHSKKDDIVEYSEFEGFIKNMKVTNNDFLYHSFDNGGHFWFYWESNAKTSTELKTRFLETHGYNSI